MTPLRVRAAGFAVLFLRAAIQGGWQARTAVQDEFARGPPPVPWSTGVCSEAFEVAAQRMFSTFLVEDSVGADVPQGALGGHTCSTRPPVQVCTPAM